jgi:hypothetical protein
VIKIDFLLQNTIFWFRLGTWSWRELLYSGYSVLDLWILGAGVRKRLSGRKPEGKSSKEVAGGKD